MAKKTVKEEELMEETQPVNTIQVILRCFKSGSISDTEAEALMDQVYGYDYLCSFLGQQTTSAGGSALVLDSGAIHGENDTVDYPEDRHIGFKQAKKTT